MRTESPSLQPAAASRPDRVILIPGLFSPRWMLVPLATHLRRRFSEVLLWDDPRIFDELERSVRSVGSLLPTSASDSARVAVVSHSFGDWLIRAALQQRNGPPLMQLISISPVTTVVPSIAWLPRSITRRVPELAVMADQQLASIPLQREQCMKQTVIWASIDLLVRREQPFDHPERRQLRVRGTHNSLVFQPSVWRLVARELSGG